MALRTARFYHHESCGKCTPCREGTNWTVKMLERVVRGEATPMDLDIVASVQENIIGHCLCVLGDSMAMPVGAMVKKFRGEFEARSMAAAAEGHRPGTLATSVRQRAPLDERGASEERKVTLIIDGREVIASEGEMLHDAARRGDVEIPVFCYEPKLGDPVGACRMCLVEIEGMPKLQTSCSTPVRDGMVVHTMTDQVKTAQSAVVEFLLVNHPLDCPVCDKGGECPLQDISIGWGPGRSRFTDPKRHFQKPVELSPLVAIDRERCILCYRCVRFSQEVAEDAQLQLLERGDRSFVGTFDDRPYIAPFHGNITELCPVGALTSYTYRFRARPWDIEQAGSVCTLCPSQCNVSFTVRDEQVKRVLGRDNAEVDDGWLCDRGRYGFEMFGAEERIERAAAKGRRRDRLADRDRSGGQGLRAAGEGKSRGDRRRRLQRGGLPAPATSARGAGLSARRVAPAARALSRGAGASSPSPSSRARVRDIDERRGDPPARHRPAAQLADPRPPDPQGDPPQRRQARRRHRAPDRARRRRRGGGSLRARRQPPASSPSWPRACGAHSRGRRHVCEVAETLREAGGVVIVWGERIAREGEAAIGPCSTSPRRSSSPRRDGSGLLEMPEVANARGLREAGCLPDAGPGLAEAADGQGHRGDPRRPRGGGAEVR